MDISKIETFYPKNKLQWRRWLAKNHQAKINVWVIFYKKSANKPTLSWSEAVDEALCFGWIDSVKKKLDDERSIQFFSKRKPKSTWSKINKDKVEKLLESGLITTAGIKCIEIAKENGSWEILNNVDVLIIPADLESALNSKAIAMDYFSSLSKTTKKGMLQWILMAKRPETRQNRILEIVELAEQKKKPKQFLTILLQRVELL